MIIIIMSRKRRNVELHNSMKQTRIKEVQDLAQLGGKDDSLGIVWLGFMAYQLP